MRILLVEDAPDIREVFTVLLRVEGADVTATGSGREAADLASRRDFDVILSDLGLPDLPGDVLILDVKMKRLIRNMGWYYGEAKVNGEVVASAEVMCAGAKG